MTPVQKVEFHEALFIVAKNYGADLKQRNDALAPYISSIDERDMIKVINLLGS